MPNDRVLGDVACHVGLDTLARRMFIDKYLIIAERMVYGAFDLHELVLRWSTHSWSRLRLGMMSRTVAPDGTLSEIC